jgi:hypothetical protein
LNDRRREDDKPAKTTPPGETTAEKTPVWRRPLVATIAVFALLVLLVGGSLYTRARVTPSRKTAEVTPAVVATKTGDPNVTVKTGQALPRISAAPAQTRSQVRLTKDIGDPVLVVEFEPYGLAGTGGAVIRLTNVTAEGGTALAAEFAKSLTGQNLVVAVAPSSAAALKTGGTYSGRITLKQADGTTSFSIAAIQRSKQ